jgi:hypothetical protein
MRHRFRAAALATVAAAALLAVGQAGAAKSRVSLDFYTAHVSSSQYADLLDKGVDVTAATPLRSGVQLDLVLSASEANGLRAQGIDVELKHNRFGRTARQEAAFQKSTGYTVWMDYDGPDGYVAWMKDLAKKNRDIVKLEVIGHTLKGRRIYAIKLTEDAKWIRDGKRDAVLYSATQHAREWIAPETDRRILQWYIDRYRAKDKSVRKLLDSTELWFVLIMNPDGYQYTFQSPDTRLWRKNLRDNNGNGTTEVGDGVDPNRNYPEHWNYDQEGSSSVQSSDTYRGPAAASELETVAMQRLLHRVNFAFQVNFHSYGPYLLYPEGWQIGAPTADDPIYFALSGNLDNPAIEGTHPGVSSDVLYGANGEATDYAHVDEGALAWTPELDEGCVGCGFVFPDDETLVQEEFEKVLPFAKDVANSAHDPADPQSHLGIETKPFYLKSDDTYKAGMPLANFSFAFSYGDPQEVRVIAKRSLGDVDLKYRINNGPTKTADTKEWKGGERYGAQTDVYYRILNGYVKGAGQGDSVKVWFEEADNKHFGHGRKASGGRHATHNEPKLAKSESFTYTVVKKTSNKVLVVAAEDYTGASPGGLPAGTQYVGYYLDALAANGIGADVYDVDAMGRVAPDALGVLSHYKAVIWYTGDDVVTRTAGWGAGNASRLAMDELLELRDYLNEGGRALYTGQWAGAQYTPNVGTQLYDPTAANEQCSVLIAGGADPRRCLPLYGSGDAMNDVLEYWFGAYLLNLGAGVGDTDFFPINGMDTPFSGLSWLLNGGDSADNQGLANSFITTTGILPISTYPQFESWPAAKYDRPGGPFDPHSGTNYMYSQIADVSYKRLSRTINVPGGTGNNLTFWTSTNTEQDWDYMFVEVHTVGSDNWTTLPDLNGNTTTATGLSCPAGWNQLHPFLDHYQTINADGTCSPTGTTGSWNAATGDSHGWHQWKVNLDAYAGQQVELSITYTSDWATQGLGVFVDDVAGLGADTSFETGLDGWTVPGQPAGSAPNANDWISTTAGGFPEGAVVATPDTLYMGFGFEGIQTTAERNAVMQRAMMDLLGP